MKRTSVRPGRIAIEASKALGTVEEAGGRQATSRFADHECGNKWPPCSRVLGHQLLDRFRDLMNGKRRLQADRTSGLGVSDRYAAGCHLREISTQAFRCGCFGKAHETSRPRTAYLCVDASTVLPNLMALADVRPKARICLLNSPRIVRGLK